MVIGLLHSTSLAAQRPQIRQGSWIAFGIGGGNLSWDCDGCSRQNHGGPTGFLRLGGTLSQKILLGAEINAWSRDVGSAAVSAGFAAFTFDWYLSATGGVFFKGGLGGAFYSRDLGPSTQGSTTGMLLMGAGYDIRVGRNTSITPTLTVWSSKKDNLTDDVTKDSSTRVATGFHYSGVTLQVGITFH